MNDASIRVAWLWNLGLWFIRDDGTIQMLEWSYEGTGHLFSPKIFLMYIQSYFSCRGIVSLSKDSSLLSWSFYTNCLLTHQIKRNERNKDNIYVWSRGWHKFNYITIEENFCFIHNWGKCTKLSGFQALFCYKTKSLQGRQQVVNIEASSIEFWFVR